MVSGGPRDPRKDELAWADLTQSMSRFAPHLPPTAHPETLSGGAARLAQICQLLWATPGIALLDQPDVGLDRRGWELMIEVLDEMRALGQAQLIATHDERLAATARFDHPARHAQRGQEGRPGVTELRELWPRIRVPPLAETPALARLVVAALWLAARAARTAADDDRPPGCRRGRAGCRIGLHAAGTGSVSAGVRCWRSCCSESLTFIVSVDDGRAAASQAVLTTLVRLSLLLVVVLLVVLPQDAEAALTEAMAFVRLPPRIAFELLVAARVVTGVPGDLAQQRLARRALDLSPGGLRGILAEPLDAVRYVLRAARQRRQSLRTGAALAALGSAGQRSMYRSVSFGRNGRYVLVAGTVVAIVALLVGLL